MEPGWSILASELGANDALESAAVAAAATMAWEKVAKHFSRIIGEAGIRILLDRSLAATRVSYPWIDEARSEGAPSWVVLRTSLAQRDPDEAVRAFAALVSSFIGLMARFIGEVLVAQLLHEVWPGVFPQEVRGIT